MTDTVKVSWAQIVEQLQNPKLQVSDWTAHCGCRHGRDGSFVKCEGHASGQDVVEAIRQ
jgi:hypothetical protein